MVTRLVKPGAVMVLGTGSHVGKSLLTAAICRILSDDGLRVAPFKAQNMSLNSAATPEGLEIGRAQAMQAEAARIAPSVDMNPILLKPTSDRGSQIVALGRVHGYAAAADYHRSRVEEFFPIVCAAYDRLAQAHDVIVLEGAGSPAEINLAAHDIVNMRMAHYADARCLLLGDIDRGGVFASLLGTMQLLDEAGRARIAAFAVNKFRGDQSLLMPGIYEIAERIARPCAGIIPWLSDIELDEEDSVALDEMPRVRDRSWQSAPVDLDRPLRVAVVAIPYLSNFTDFSALSLEPSIDLAYAAQASELREADVVIIPGTKTTHAALSWLQEHDFAAALALHATKGLLIGICGGMQILGHAISDPHGVESGGTSTGFGLLPIDTELGKAKVTQRARFVIPTRSVFGENAEPIFGDGYEIHMGYSRYYEDAEPFAEIRRDDGSVVRDGARTERVLGTYLHGIFAHDGARHALIRTMRSCLGLYAPKQLIQIATVREAAFDRLAAHVRKHLDLALLVP
jgi:adenosylcobyric acid synthase